MRLFVAIPFSDKILRSLQKIQCPLQGIRWQKAGQIHLTLRFLGDTSQKELPELKTALSTVRMKKFTIQIEGLGVFPGKRSPRIIWAGVEKSESLLDLQRAIEMQCRSAGFEAETKPYHPHITLARVKNASSKQIKSFLRSERAESLHLQTNTDHFNLYRSELHPEGAMHKVLKQYLLTS